MRKVSRKFQAGDCNERKGRALALIDFDAGRHETSTVMILRAAFAFLALPGVVAYLVPGVVAATTAREAGPALAGLVVMGLGTLVLLWCARAFFVQGEGTLAPWSPPVRLVRRGLYGLTRNPMYVGVLIILAGWALAYSSSILALYAFAVAVAFHLRVVLGEEPALARTFGAQWQEYSAAVPRWFGPIARPAREDRNDS